MIYCSNCGQLVPKESNFCKFCGAPQHGSQSAVFRVSDLIVEHPQLVTHLPKQAMRKDVEYIPRKHLGADAILFFFVQLWGKSFLLFFLVLIGAVLQPWPFLLALAGYFIGLLIVALFIHSNFTYEINKDGLMLEQGILHRYHVSVPYEQIQNVNIERTLLDRFLGFAKVSIETAGAAAVANGTIKSPKAEAFIPGIHLEEAKKVHDLLIDGADGAHGS